MSRNRFLNLSKLRYPYAASIMVWATSFPASILALLSTTPNSFFASPLAISTSHFLYVAATFDTTSQLQFSSFLATNLTFSRHLANVSSTLMYLYRSWRQS